MEFTLPKQSAQTSNSGNGGRPDKRVFVVAGSVVALGLLASLAIVASQTLKKKEKVSPEKSGASGPVASCSVVAHNGDEVCVAQYGRDRCEECAGDPHACLQDSGCFTASGCPKEGCTISRSAECGGVQIEVNWTPEGSDDSCIASVPLDQCDECGGGPPPPPPPENEYSCDLLTMSPDDPGVGDSVSFHCEGTFVPPTRTSRTYFKVVAPGGATQEFECPGDGCDQPSCVSEGDGVRCSVDFSYPQPVEAGDYKVCSKVCRGYGCINGVCNPVDCTEYDERCN